MQYDLFHVYTVDEHSLMVVRNMRRFTVEAHADEYPLCSSLIKTLPKPELLYLAGLFHDIAKGRGGDHSELGAADAYAFCIHHGLSEYDATLVAWLVRNHLIMSMTAQRKDISDPQVIHEFATRVATTTRLDYLYLLTVADIRATNPEMWNSWKDALLRELYNTTKRALQRGLENPIQVEEQIRITQDAARELLRDQPVDMAAVDELWQQHSEDYFLNHVPDEIAWHTTSILNTHPDDYPLVLLRPSEYRGSTAIFIYGKVKDHQFALVTALLEQAGLTIVGARITHSGKRYTLDNYQVLELDGQPASDPARLKEIHTLLQTNVREMPDYDFSFSRRLRRQQRHFETDTRVEFQLDEGNERTIMELTTTDRIGVLSRVGQAFIECKVRLQNARVSTIGERAEDVFYITDLNDEALHDPDQMECLRKNLISMLDGEE